jgi:hypothetical protein
MAAQSAKLAICIHPFSNSRARQITEGRRLARLSLSKPVADYGARESTQCHPACVPTSAPEKTKPPDICPHRFPKTTAITASPAAPRGQNPGLLSQKIEFAARGQNPAITLFQPPGSLLPAPCFPPPVFLLCPTTLISMKGEKTGSFYAGPRLLVRSHALLLKRHSYGSVDAILHS